MKTLRARFSLVFVLMALLTSLLFGGLTFHLFVKQQWAHLLEVMERDLSHVQALVKNPEVGASFVGPQRGELMLQFVSPDGTLLLRIARKGTSPPIPQPSSLPMHAHDPCAKGRLCNASGEVMGMGLNALHKPIAKSKPKAIGLCNDEA